MLKAAALTAAFGLFSCAMLASSAHAQQYAPQPNRPETWQHVTESHPPQHVHAQPARHHHEHAHPHYQHQQRYAPHHGGRAWFGYTREERKEFPVYYHGYRRYEGGFHASYYRTYPGFQQGIYDERYGYGAGWGW